MINNDLIFLSDVYLDKEYKSSINPDSYILILNFQYQIEEIRVRIK